MKEPIKEREIAIVTGGSSSIGLAIAQEFVKLLSVAIRKNFNAQKMT